MTELLWEDEVWFLHQLTRKTWLQLGEDWMIVAATWVPLLVWSLEPLAVSTTRLQGFNIPVDGLISVGLGVAGTSDVRRYWQGPQDC